MADGELLSLTELEAELKRLGVKPSSRASIWRIRKTTGDAGPLREIGGQIYGTAADVIEWIRKKPPREPRVPAPAQVTEDRAAQPVAARASAPGGHALFDVDILDEVDELGEIDDPEWAIRSSLRVQVKLERLVRAMNLRALADGKSAKTAIPILEACSRTIARLAKAREDLIRTRERERSLLELARVEKFLDGLGGLHGRRYADLSASIVSTTMAVLAKSGVEPSFSSDLLKDELALVIDRHREKVAGDVAEVARDLAA